MNENLLKIAIITNVIATYLKGFYDRLFSRKDLRVKVYCQDRIPGMNINTIHHQYPNNVHLLKYLSANREKLAWQFVPWKEILNGYDVVFVGGNPRVLSDALFAGLLKLFRKKMVLWTMAHSFRNSPFEGLPIVWTRERLG